MPPCFPGPYIGCTFNPSPGASASAQTSARTGNGSRYVPIFQTIGTAGKNGYTDAVW